jgi:hypothetical protein
MNIQRGLNNHKVNFTHQSISEFEKRIDCILLLFSLLEYLYIFIV